MVSLSLIIINRYLCTTPTAIFLFFSTVAIVALCAKHGFVRKKSQNEASNQITSPISLSPLESPRKLAKNIGKKAVSQCLRSNQQENVNGESCLWKKDILMGEKCQPLQFSGAIYYDCEGNMLSAPPARSPKIAGGTSSPNLPAISGLEANRDMKIDVKE